MEPLSELLELLEDKLQTIRRMIDEFEEGMDYATHCTLQGFAEGLSYAIEEIQKKQERQ
jgi:hypothetical protein